MKSTPSFFQIKGNVIDVLKREIYFAELTIENNRILSINHLGAVSEAYPYISCGFVDAHIHIESSMLTPCQFARLAVVHGTVATVSDPHEIANVMGIEGVEYMIENGKRVDFKFYFGCPSCVPATSFETAGATIDVAGVEKLMSKPEIKYLAEMMNFPAVLNADKEVMQKLAIAKKYNKPIDGHAPGLRGQQAIQYASAGISTDHECFTAPEAYDKLAAGMHILIREGSAACNFDALIEILPQYFHKVMFCSDDKHPDSLVRGHINELVLRALALGMNLMDVLQVACVNPVRHYGLDVGLLQAGDAADFIVIDNLKNWNVEQTYINGNLVAENGKSLIESLESETINQFNVSLKSEKDFEVLIETNRLKIIEVLDKQLITNKLILEPTFKNGQVRADVEKDILKIAVVNRYFDAPVAVGFVKNFGLKYGAIASSVAHDSHNIIVVGVDDASIYEAVNMIIEAKGGISAVGAGTEKLLALPIAGIMTGEDGYKVARLYQEMDMIAKQMGSTLAAPFMSLSFMGLLVIPSLKMSDFGLFDGENFEFVSNFS